MKDLLSQTDFNVYQQPNKGFEQTNEWNKVYHTTVSINSNCRELAFFIYILLMPFRLMNDFCQRFGLTISKFPVWIFEKKNNFLFSGKLIYLILI